jgi:hypothetical protein
MMYIIIPFKITLIFLLMLFYISSFITMFIISDIFMKKFSIEGRYYMNHFIGNMIIAYNTFNCMIQSYNINSIQCNSELIDYTKNIIYSIHLYHILWYYNKLRFDDWLHHILMCGIALPLTYNTDYNNLIAHGIFFITGLPGGIDYLLLFMVRNNIIDRMIEKKFNLYINLWLRCPGCISNITLIIATIVTNYNSILYSQLIGSIIIIGTIYWNGIYFMEQVVSNYAVEFKKKLKN